MELKKNEKLEDGRVLLEFLIDRPTFDEAVTAVYRREVVKINVPGFRKGKAPKSIIEKMYGKEIFFEDAINDIIPEAYTTAVDVSGIKAVGRPEIDIVTIDENGVLLSAKTFVEPEIVIEGYKGLNITVPAVKEATDEEVSAEIQTIRERNSREIEITDRPVQDGDKAFIDFEGFVDGVAFENGSAQNQPLVIGSGSFIPGFEEQIVGHSIGEEFDINVTFPTEYHEASLAGKEAIFKIKINSISVVEYPELDDDFAADVSEFNTFAEYSADIKAKIQKRHENENDNAKGEAINEALAGLVTDEIPAPMIESETENLLNEYDNNFRRQGFSLESYLSITGQTLDAIRDQLRPASIARVKVRLALDKIAELENIEVTEEELENEFKQISEAYSVDLDTVKGAIRAEDLKKDIASRKAFDLVKENAEITVAVEVETEPEAVETEEVSE